MQLYISPTSPYARKAHIMVLEKGLAEKVRITPLNPWESPPELVDKNPLSQVPVLLLEDGEILYDSRVICAFLDEQGTGPQLIPSQGLQRIRVLRMEALGDGMTDAAVNAFFGRKDNGDNPDTRAITRQLNKIIAALDVMQDGLADFEGQFHLGTIAYGAALSYLDLRYGDLQWRGRVPELGKWFDELDKRPSMVATVPVA
ncbi:MAG: glutathione S-transferase N-terminal domain-containing protein [Hyphomicrobiaceae bacterium]|nr:glutathione S-transferase N-terminal domain-containing protein [Hyphomicrobiaceae bacterium]